MTSNLQEMASPLVYKAPENPVPRQSDQGLQVLTHLQMQLVEVKAHVYTIVYNDSTRFPFWLSDMFHCIRTLCFIKFGVGNWILLGGKG